MKRTTILGLAFMLVLTFGLLVACGPQDTDNEATYTVTVTCTDASALSDVKVQLKQGDTLKGESTLTDGKATFKLEKGDYTVTLTGVPSGYLFTAGSVSATKLDCTIELKAGYTYSVTVTYPERKDVYDNSVSAAAPAENVKVALYEGKLDDDRGTALDGKTPADTKTTDKDGKVSFELKGDSYTIVLADYDETLKLNYPEGERVNTVTKDTPNAQLTFKEPARIGSTADVPLTFNLGANNVPLTNTALSYAIYGGIAYSFTPENTGNYTIEATENAIVLDETMTPVVTGGQSAVIALEGGKAKLFYCTASETPKTYTVTITEGGDIGGGGDEEPTYPWTEGEGTVDKPYVAENLAGTYTDLAASGNLLVVSYTPAADEEWIFTQIGDDLWLVIYDDKEKLASGNPYLLQIGNDITTGNVSMTNGTEYYLVIRTWSEGPNKVSFKAELGSGSPTQSGNGTIEHPFVLDNIDRAYTCEVPDQNSLVYYSYSPTEIEYYTITANSDNVWVTISEKDSGTRVFSGGTEEMPKDFTLQAGKTYLIEVDAEEYQKDDPTVSFSITQKAEATELYKVAVTVKLVNGNAAGEGIIVRLVNIDNTNDYYDAVTDATGVAHFEDVPDGEYSVQAPRVVFTGGELVESALPDDQELTLNAYSVEVDGGDATIEVKLSERATTPEE